MSLKKKYTHIYFRYIDWWNTRLFAILSSPILFFELEMFFLIQPILFIHMYFGLETMFKDYVHNFMLKLLYILMFSVFVMQFLRISLEFWF